MTTITQPPSTVLPQRRGAVSRFIVRHPIGAFLIGAYGVGGPLLTLYTTASLPRFMTTALGLAFTYLGLLGSALVVTWVTGGRRAVLGFLARFLQWRFGLARWLYIVLALPLLTVIVAALSGTLQTPAGGWVTLVTGFLVQTFVYGALEVNIAEEGAWSGFVQGRFSERHGILGGALRTTPLFVAMHLPLQFASGWSWGSVVVGVAVLAAMAPFFRYLLGETLHATGGSLLAVGILHAAFNASAQLGFPGGWQFLPAVMVLALAVGLLGRFHRARRFAVHYLEMVVAMVAGMVILGPLESLVIDAAGWSSAFDGAGVTAVVMATNMTIAMAGWMRFRGHSKAPIIEMSAAMYVPFLLLLAPLRQGHITEQTFVGGGHVLMLLGMLLAMLLRRDEYTGHH